MSRGPHRSEVATEHPFVAQAKQLAREAGSTDNATINWALKLLEDSLAFGNQKR